MRPITGVVQHYDWGTTDAIPEFLGATPDGQPWAEYWLGLEQLLSLSEVYDKARRQTRTIQRAAHRGACRDIHQRVLECSC